jgi:hypothetical protein
MMLLSKWRYAFGFNCSEFLRGVQISSQSTCTDMKILMLTCNSNTALRKRRKEEFIAVDNIKIIREFSEIYIPVNFLVFSFWKFQDQLQLHYNLMRLPEFIEMPLSRIVRRCHYNIA